MPEPPIMKGKKHVASLSIPLNNQNSCVTANTFRGGEIAFITRERQNVSHNSPHEGERLIMRENNHWTGVLPSSSRRKRRGWRVPLMLIFRLHKTVPALIRVPHAYLNRCPHFERMLPNARVMMKD